MPYVDDAARCYAETYGALDPGQLNYLITKACDDYLAKTGVTYARLNEVIGVLACAQHEIYRRLAGPYEDKAIARNGDVFTVA